ncbi:hypothetical protein PBY51_005028 [Eleginops maclovinus]|uniref:Chromosomal protein D1-like n=1 Tax=Eleginops maclovinus TaxID=56733 RepID=A0AAN8AH06_ELEMC|nr:hypothetical protein PBY51_005028 [Eleginops maclovinus]
MEEETITTETAEGDVAPNEEEPSVEMTNDSPSKRGRGRPKGAKKLEVGVTDVNLMVSGISNGGPPQTQRGRGRPKLIKPTEQQGSGDNNADDSGSQKQASDEDGATTELSPKKRGRPRKSLSTPAKVDTPKRQRGRPKGSTKRKSESPSESGSPNKKPRQEAVKKRGRPRKVEGASNGISKKSHRGRGRPRKSIEQESGDEKRRRGRPKGSLNKKPVAYKVQAKVGRANKGKRGRPRKEPATRGRPRKYPRPSAEELNKPRVWKPLGRPRKYPRPDPPEESSPTPPRNRGRPRKTESKKGAHLRKNFPASSSSPPSPNVEPPRKRGRPPKSDADPPRKLGRPKGSVNKNKATSELEAAPPSEASEEQTVEEEVQQNAETSIEDVSEESLIDQAASFEVTNQT